MAREIHTDITRLLEILDASGNNYNREKIEQAYAYAAELHEGQLTIFKVILPQYRVTKRASSMTLSLAS